MHHHIPAQRAESAAAYLKAQVYPLHQTRSLRVILPAQKNRSAPPKPPTALPSERPGEGAAGPDIPPPGPHAAGAASPGHGRHRGTRRRILGWW